MIALLTLTTLALAAPRPVPIHLVAHDAPLIATGAVVSGELVISLVLKDRTAKRQATPGKMLKLVEPPAEGHYLLLISPSPGGGFTSRAYPLSRDTGGTPWITIRDMPHSGVRLPRTLRVKWSDNKRTARFALHDFAALLRRPVRLSEYD